eukprot:scaffold203765_cov46-Attheya_sp.AAC.1
MGLAATWIFKQFAFSSKCRNCCAVIWANVRNAHRMLQIMFARIESLMKDGGLEIDGLEDSISGVCIKLLFKFAIAFVIGDFRT